MRCFCTPQLHPPFSDTSPSFPNGVCKRSPPDPVGQPFRCACHSAGVHSRLPCHLSQSCKQWPSDNQDFCSNDWRLYPHFCKQTSPVYSQRTPSTTCFGRCTHFHPWKPSVQAEENSTKPVFCERAALSRDSVREAANFAEHQFTARNCTVCSLDTRYLDATCQHGCCVPSVTKHYAIYSSPVSLSNLQNECGHRFSNNVPPVLVAVYPSQLGSPPHVEQLAQIDRTPVPSIPDSYWVFSRY